MNQIGTNQTATIRADVHWKHSFCFVLCVQKKEKNTVHHWKKNVNTTSIIFVLKIKIIRNEKRNYTLSHVTCLSKWSAKLKVILFVAVCIRLTVYYV
jgi:hypothetical protein